MLFAPFALFSQQTNGNTATPAASDDRLRQMVQSLLEDQRRQIEARAGVACPVGFSVNRVAAGAVVWTDSKQAARHGQGLDITFARLFNRIAGAPAGAAKGGMAQIVSADIVVHGYPPTTRAIPATPSAPKEVTESFHLAPDADQPLLHTSVWTAMTAIRWVELTRLDYADGTSWQSSTPRECTAAPSLYVPASAR
jgi:hypothetical protein